MGSEKGRGRSCYLIDSPKAQVLGKRLYVASCEGTMLEACKLWMCMLVPEVMAASIECKQLATMEGWRFPLLKSAKIRDQSYITSVWETAYRFQWWKRKCLRLPTMIGRGIRGAQIAAVPSRR